MAITNAQQYKQMQLVKPRADGKRPGYYGADAGFGDDDYKDAASDFQDSFNEKTSGGGNYISDSDARRVLDARPDLQQGIDNAAKYRADADKRRKEKEKADKARKKEEEKKAKKETRDARRKETKAQKKARQMKLAAFERFQRLDKYVDPFGDYTTFADMTGEEAAQLAGYNVNEFGPPGSITYEYDKDRFRDPKTGKIKSELTEMVDINKGKKDIFGRDKKPKFVEQFRSDINVGDPKNYRAAIPGYDFSPSKTVSAVRNNFDGGLGTLTGTGGVRPNDYGIQPKTGTSLDILSNFVRPEDGLQAFNTLEEARNIQDLAGRFQGGDKSAYEEFEDYITRNKVPTTGGGRDSDNQTDPCLGPNPPAYCNVNNNPTDPVDPRSNFYGLSPRIGGSIFDFSNLAEGGRVPAMDGGIMDLARQELFLGGIAKGIKKAVRGVKKLAKSPLGKAAILGAVGFGLGSKGALGSFFGKGSLNPFLAKSIGGDTMFSGLGSILSKAGLVSKAGLPTFKGGIALASILPLLAGKQDDEFDIDAYYAANQLTPATTARQAGSEFDFYNYNLAEGGMPSKEPVAKKVMPLLDMDGMEKDYRAEGGFVPIGRMEKADDVPARLSKNEFVFTADAVRNAGEGDVDKGAEVMYNMMKNLESGGEISEESQGLDGAREMFQTSQRLGEVI